MDDSNSFVVVANRLPVDMTVHPDGSYSISPSPGGLVTGLSPVLEQHRGCWVGWPGTVDVAPEPFRTDTGVLLHPVVLTASDYEGFYEGFSNATLWPLFHDLIVTPVYNTDWWHAFREVNLKFAEAVSQVAAHGATVWVQDYQLLLVPGILRQMRPDLKIGFFLHIPFPSPDLFRQLPWREEIVRGMLGADLVGFHLVQNAENFLALTQQVAGTAGSHVGQPDTLQVSGEALVREIGAHVETADGRRVSVGAFPISIDVEMFGEASKSAVLDLLKTLDEPETVFLGVDRLDYAKGILQRLLAFEELLESGALEADKAVLLQVATPSRERIDHYRVSRSQVEEAVGRINGRFGRMGRPVVHYLHRSLSKNDLQVLYTAADVMLVTPFKDGMNLVAKEFVANHRDGTGALVLSEFAGAATELTGAYLCNPFDVESIKRQMVAAVHDLKHNPESAATRMKTNSEQVYTHDVNVWANSFLDCLAQSGENS